MNSRISKQAVEEHLQTFPVAEHIMLLPNEIKGSRMLSVKGKRKKVWCLRSNIYTSLDELGIIVHGEVFGDNAILNLYRAIKKHVNAEQIKLRSNTKYFYKCNNEMGPFCNMKSELVMMNGSRFMQKKGVTIDESGRLYESHDRQIVGPDEYCEKLHMIGKLQ